MFGCCLCHVFDSFPSKRFIQSEISLFPEKRSVAFIQRDVVGGCGGKSRDHRRKTSQEPYEIAKMTEETHRPTQLGRAPASRKEHQDRPIFVPSEHSPDTTLHSHKQKKGKDSDEETVHRTGRAPASRHSS